MPNVFEIADEDSGKIYRIEAEDGVTQEQALEQFQSLPDTEWGSYEYSTPVTQAPAAPASPEVAAPVAAPTVAGPSAPVVPRTPTQAYSGETEYGLKLDNIGKAPSEIKSLLPKDEQEYVRLVEDPNVPVEDIDAFLRQASGGEYGLSSPEAVAQINEIRKQGGSSGVVSYANPFEGLQNQEYLDELASPEEDDYFNQFGRSLLASWADPATGSSMIGRGINDLLDTGIDQLAERFPNATPEELEELQTRYVGFLNRKVSEAREQGVSEDAFVPWIAGQFLALDPIDAVPFARAARSGTKIGRALEKGAEAGGVNALADAAYQGAAISAGAQDEFDPLRTAGAAALGAGFGGLAQGVSDLGPSVRTSTPESRPTANMSLEEAQAYAASKKPTSIAVPTARKGSKKYKEQLDATQDSVIDQVNSLTEGWTNVPNVQVHKNFDELEGVSNSAVGVYTKKVDPATGEEVPVIYLNTEAVLLRAKKRDVSPEAVVESVTFHEALGHHGLAQLFRKDLDHFLDDVYTNGSKEFRSQVDEWLEKNPGSYARYSEESRRILATEEVMAEWSEKNGVLPKTAIDGILNTIKDFGRRMGMDLKYTTRELKAYVAIANRRTTEGNPSTATSSADRYEDEYTPSETTSAGFRRPKIDDRFRREDQKLRRANAERNDPFAEPVNKYSDDPNDLTADDLIEAKNAYEILERMTRDYKGVTISPDQVEAELTARGVTPSEVLRLVPMEPGTLVRKALMHDIASQKLNDRALKVKQDILDNGLTEQKQFEYMKAMTSLVDIQHDIWDMRSEYARAMAVGRKLQYTKKKVGNLKSLLEQYNLQHAQDPEGFFKFMEAVEAQTKAKTRANPDLSQGVFKGIAKGLYNKDTRASSIYSLINLPRAVMSSADLSAPLRQGVVFISYPEYWGAFAKMFSYIGKSGENNYNFLMKDIAKHPNYPLMEKARVAFSQLDGQLSAREEDFQTELARMLPLGAGKIVKQSEQAYAGFLNKLRADMFNRFVDQYKKAGIETDDDFLLKLGQFVNASTGRAELPKAIRPASNLINATFFSGRLMYSRVQMLNPLFYRSLPAPVRKEAMRSMLAFGAIASTVVGTVNALWDDEVDVETDPRSSDFMKIRMGDTRLDVGGGFSQYLVLGARTSTWLYNNTLQGFEDRAGVDTTDLRVANKKTVSGKYKTFDNKIGGQTYGGALSDFFRTKLSPQMSYVVDGMVGESIVGEPFTVGGSLASRLVPMTAGSTWDAYVKDSPVPMPLVAGLSLFGVGVSTYGNPATDKDQTLEAPLSFTMSELEDGENDFLRAEEGEVILKKQTRDMWQSSLDNYYPYFVSEFTLQMGKTWEELSDNEREAVIKKAKNAARDNAKKDMLYELGLD